MIIVMMITIIIVMIIVNSDDHHDYLNCHYDVVFDIYDDKHERPGEMEHGLLDS